MRLHSLLLLPTMALSIPAHANTILDLSGRLETSRVGDSTGVYDHGNPITGTLTLNDAGQFIAVNASYLYNLNTDVHPENVTVKLNSILSVAQILDGSYTKVTIAGSGTDGNASGYISLGLLFSTDALTTQNTIALCSLNAPCTSSYLNSGGQAVVSTLHTSHSGASNLETGVLTREVALVPPAAVTPEPSGLLLLGTGVLGMCGALRRRVQMRA